LPDVAPLGTVVEILEPDTTMNAACVPLELTLAVLFRLVPRMVTGVPTLPEVGTVTTNGVRPAARLKTVPQP
jgi:hypothetical protein